MIPKFVAEIQFYFAEELSDAKERNVQLTARLQQREADLDEARTDLETLAQEKERLRERVITMGFRKPDNSSFQTVTSRLIIGWPNFWTLRCGPKTRLKFGIWSMMLNTE